MALTLGEVKQEVTRIYNLVNQEMYDIGTDWVRVEVAGRYILIVAKHRRLPASAVIDARAPFISRMFDIFLLDEFKERFKAELCSRLSLSVECILKDYDPQNELAGTMVILRERLA